MSKFLKTYPFGWTTWQTYPIWRDFNLINVNKTKGNKSYIFVFHYMVYKEHKLRVLCHYGYTTYCPLKGLLWLLKTEPNCFNPNCTLIDTKNHTDKEGPVQSKTPILRVPHFPHFRPKKNPFPSLFNTHIRAGFQTSQPPRVSWPLLTLYTYSSRIKGLQQPSTLASRGRTLRPGSSSRILNLRFWRRWPDWTDSAFQPNPFSR